MPKRKRLPRGRLALRIDRTRSVPSYMQLAEQLRARITAGDFRPGARLPAERELITASRLSRITVRQGLAVLEREGWVERKQGLGTFARHPIDQKLGSAQTITEVLLEQGITPEIKVLGFGAVVPPPRVRQALRLPQGERLILVKRLYCYQGQAIALIHIYLPLAVAEEAEILRRATVPTDTTYTIWEDRLGVQLKEARYIIRAGAATREVARALRVKMAPRSWSSNASRIRTKAALLSTSSFTIMRNGTSSPRCCPGRERGPRATAGMDALSTPAIPRNARTAGAMPRRSGGEGRRIRSDPGPHDPRTGGHQLWRYAHGRLPRRGAGVRLHLAL
jgi:GntR family transcriptional regulator